MKKKTLLLLLGCAAIAGCQSTEGSRADTPEMTSAIADSAHNSRNSLDWIGVYKGMVPCGDCEGTNILLELDKDGSYMMSRNHIGKMSIAVMEEGKVMWNDAGSQITIDDLIFQVRENQLLLLGGDGKPAFDEKGETFLLNKQY